MPESLVPLLKVAGQTLAIYLFLVVGLAGLGRRQMSQLTSLELVILLILGSSVETAMVAGNTSLPAGLISAATLLIANRLLAILLRRSGRLRRWIVGGPVLLVQDGHLIHSHLRRVGFTENDVLQAIRERGYSDLDQIYFAYLEVDGSVGVIPREQAARQTSDTRRSSQPVVPATPPSAGGTLSREQSDR